MNETDEGAIAEAALQLAELGSLRLLQAQNPSPPLHPFLLSLSLTLPLHACFPCSPSKRGFLCGKTKISKTFPAITNTKLAWVPQVDRSSLDNDRKDKEKSKCVHCTRFPDRRQAITLHDCILSSTSKIAPFGKGGGDESIIASLEGKLSPKLWDSHLPSFTRSVLFSAVAPLISKKKKVITKARV